MAVEIRNFKLADLSGIEGLFRKKVAKEFEWLFRDPYKKNKYNAFVAVNEKEEVVGMIAYALASYKYYDRKVRGVIPMSWMIRQDYKGFIGIKLIKKVFELGDFGLAIGGSTAAKEIYPVFKLQHTGNVDEYYMLFNPFESVLSGSKSFKNSLGTTLIALPSFLFKRYRYQKKIADLEIVHLKSLKGIDINNPFEHKTFLKQVDKSFLEWLLDCPLHESHSFLIRLANNTLGVAICYIERRGRYSRGRIVHYPYLGSDLNIWTEVLKYLLTFLMKEKCCIVSALAYHPIQTKILKKLNFYRNPRKSKPLYVRDLKGLLANVPLREWLIQYSEGDKAYRNL